MTKKTYRTKVVKISNLTLLESERPQMTSKIERKYILYTNIYYLRYMPKYVRNKQPQRVGTTAVTANYLASTR